MAANEWQKKLLENLPAIAVTCHGDAICVDLRWISASDDSRLAEALGGAITVGSSV
jgi:hypothetical protein